MLKCQKIYWKSILSLALVLLIGLVNSMYLPLPTYGTTTTDISYEAGKRIASGGDHALALKSEGTVVAWGKNDFGQCNVPENLNNVVAVAAGGSFSLALKADGTVIAWGSNDYGQCNVPDDLDDAIAISAGGWHCVALKSDGTIVTWGRNGSGQCTVPLGLNNITRISAGQTHNLALANGTVAAWGWNGYNLCTVPPCFETAHGVATGAESSMVLFADKTIEIWGRTEVSWTVVPEGLLNVVNIDGGYWHSLALLADGTVVAWGLNGYGQCNTPGLHNVKAISSYGHFSLALQSDGTVVAWGKNDFGQCNVPAGLNLSGRLENLSLNVDNLLLPQLDFDPDTLNYTVEVPSSITMLDLTASVENPGTQELWVQDEQQDNGVTKTITLAEGANPISVTVKTPAEGLIRTYTITVNRAPSDPSDTDLLQLEIDSGELSPAFDPATTTYMVTLNNDINHITLSAQPKDAHTSVSINGEDSEAGMAHTLNIPIQPGKTTVPVTVTAENGASKTYQITFYQLDLSLSAQTIRAGKQLTASGIAFPGTPVQINLIRADEEIIVSHPVEADENGRFSVTFPIPRATRGACSLRATTGENQSSSKELLVKSPSHSPYANINTEPADTSYDPSANSPTLEIILFVGNSTAQINGKTVKLDTGLFIQHASQTIMVPLHFLCKCLDATVNSLPNSRKIIITIQQAEQENNYITLIIRP